MQDAEEKGLNDAEFEAALFATIYERFDFLPEDLRMRHTVFCIKCLLVNQPDLFASRNLQGCLDIVADINAPHGTFDMQALILLHWPPKRPPPKATTTAPSKSKKKQSAIPQEPFATIMDKENHSIRLVNSILPQTETRSMMLDLYCQRQSITNESTGERLNGTAPYDFDAALPLHHAYAAETISLSRAKYLLVCGSTAKKFFQKNFALDKSSSKGSSITANIGGCQRTVFFVPHPEYLSRFAAVQELSTIVQTLQEFGRLSGQRVDLAWFTEKADRKTDGQEPDMELPHRADVKRNRAEISGELEEYTDQSCWKGDWFQGYKKRVNLETLEQHVGAQTLKRFHKDTPEGRALRECFSTTSRRWGRWGDKTTPEGIALRALRVAESRARWDKDTDEGAARRGHLSALGHERFDPETVDGVARRQHMSASASNQWDPSTAEGRAFREKKVNALHERFDIDTEVGRANRQHMSAVGSERYSVETEEGREWREKAKDWANEWLDNGGRAFMDQHNKKMYDPSTEIGLQRRQHQSVIQKAIRDPSNPRSHEIKAKQAATRKANLDPTTESGLQMRKDMSDRAKALRDPSNPRSHEIKAKATATRKQTQDLDTSSGRASRFGKSLQAVKEQINSADIDAE